MPSPDLRGVSYSTAPGRGLREIHPPRRFRVGICCAAVSGGRIVGNGCPTCPTLGSLPMSPRLVDELLEPLPVRGAARPPRVRHPLVDVQVRPPEMHLPELRHLLQHRVV